MAKTKVLVVDDSLLIRAVLTEIINAAPDLCVAAAVGDAALAREAIKTFRPDVMTLDVDMPKVDGLTFLEEVMRLQPLPVVMVSGLTGRDSETTLRALEIGAVDFVCKPRIDPVKGIQSSADEICEKLRSAYQSKRFFSKTGFPRGQPSSAEQSGAVSLSSNVLQERLVLIGASTGGTEALREVLVRFPEKMPGILVVQHMPEMFTNSFARRLDGVCQLSVKEAEHGERVRPGTVYIAPGHSHLMVKRSGGGFLCELSKTEPVNRHRPSVDVLFHSAAQQVGHQGIGVLLTGMGKDGALGMLAMRNAGAYNICQDQESSVVWGMPREATINGAAHETASLHDIPARVMNRLRALHGAIH